MSLDSRITVGMTSTQRFALDLMNVEAPLSIERSLVLRNGTGAGNADRLFTDTRTLAASATEDLDLAGGLTDAVGAAITNARIKAIYIGASASNANNVLVGGAATNQFVNWVSDATDKVVIRPGGFILLGTGQSDATCYPVTAGTGDLLRIGNSGAGTGVTYDIVLLGCSA